jgi:hypothetical protein
LLPAFLLVSLFPSLPIFLKSILDFFPIKMIIDLLGKQNKNVVYLFVYSLPLDL